MTFLQVESITEKKTSINTFLSDFYCVRAIYRKWHRFKNGGHKLEDIYWLYIISPRQDFHWTDFLLWVKKSRACSDMCIRPSPSRGQLETHTANKYIMEIKYQICDENRNKYEEKNAVRIKFSSSNMYCNKLGLCLRIKLSLWKFQI